ncbi:hypothetical protein [Geothrix terrae]|uniref:hypothetical protein n=1 Tax=Geothrix terrae TaxID=2922720 RepID=UPI001FADF30D|nr:hypothetical protein [Geothrix terrae]
MPLNASNILLFIAGLLALAKVLSTLWLVRQEEAERVLGSPSGRWIYYTGKVTPALFLVTLAVRSWLGGDPSGARNYLFLLVGVGVVAIYVTRLRKAGKWFGFAHQLKRKAKTPAQP